MASNTHTTTQVVRTVEALGVLRSLWDGMQLHPDAEMDLYLTLFKTRPQILRPHVVILKKNDNPQSVLLGRLEKTRLSVRFGYGKLSLPPVRCLTLLANALSGDDSEDAVSALVNSVETSLGNKEADVAYFHQIDTGSSVYRILKNAGGILRRDHFPAFNHHWSVRLPATYAAFLQQLQHRSPKTKYNWKFYSKRLHDSFGNQIAIRTFRDISDIQRLMADTEAVARKTYHRSLEVGFMDNGETRQRMHLYASQNRLRAWILYVGEKPVAFWHGFFYGHTFFPWTTGYDPDYRTVSPGQFLLQRLFQDLCNEGIAEVVDFGSGDAEYKRHLCDENRREVSIYLFGPAIRGVLVNILRTCLLGCSTAAGRVFTKMGLLQGTKRLWRGYLTRQRGSRMRTE